MRGYRIVPFSQTRLLLRRVDVSPAAVTDFPNAPGKVLLEMIGILAAALGTAFGINLMLLVFHIA